jgi:ribosomal protein L11 methyltransferase
MTRTGSRYPALDLRFAPGPGAGTLQDMLYAELDSFEPVAIQEHESGDAWRVFFRTPAQRDSARRALASEFENALELRAIDVEDEDWARRSQAALTAARAGRIVVAPPWDVPRGRASSFDQAQDDPEAPEGSIVIIIDPSTGFGTGHHATTRLCLELLQELDVHGKRVIDVGTGSGVLAIAAAKLGAREVIGIDNDPDALRNARDNVQRNGVGVELLEEDLSAISLPSADVVLANLTSAVLQRFAESLRKLVRPGGVIIVSGFGPDDVDDVAAALGSSIVMARTARSERRSASAVEGARRGAGDPADSNDAWAAASLAIGDNRSSA